MYTQLLIGVSQVRQQRVLATHQLSWELYEKRELAASRSLFAETFVIHIAGYPRDLGLDEYVYQGEDWFSAFPDFNLQIEDQVSEGDRVVTRAIMRGTHQSKEVAVSEILIDRLEDGKIIERWANWDLIGMMQQFDLMPSLDIMQTTPGRTALRPAGKRRYTAVALLLGSLLGLARIWRRSR